MARNVFASRFRIAWLMLLPMVSGCVTPRNHLTFQAASGGAQYRQHFSSCYMLRNPAGDYHFVLVADGVQTPRDQAPDAPLEPAKIAPLRQVVHVHVFWRPRKGSKPDNPSSTNASIDWYFISHAGLPEQSVVHYAGSGFVSLGVSMKSAAVHVRSVSIAPGAIVGNLRDALGSGNVSGDFIAIHDPGEVRDLLGEIQTLND
jgi:hypothetical protein